MAIKEKNTWVLLFFILAGLVIGGLLGQLAGQVSWLSWLSYSQAFSVDLSILQLTMKINVASILGLIIAIFIYKKI